MGGLDGALIKRFGFGGYRRLSKYSIRAVGKRGLSRVSSSRNAVGLGANSTGAFVVRSGEGCSFPVKMDGVINSSSIKQKPAHGTLKKHNVSTYEYISKAGYKGPDSFSVEFKGKGPTSSGTSVITMQATVQ